MQRHNTHTHTHPGVKRVPGTQSDKSWRSCVVVINLCRKMRIHTRKRQVVCWNRTISCLQMKFDIHLLSDFNSVSLCLHEQWVFLWYNYLSQCKDNFHDFNRFTQSHKKVCVKRITPGRWGISSLSDQDFFPLSRTLKSSGTHGTVWFFFMMETQIMRQTVAGAKPNTHSWQHHFSHFSSVKPNYYNESCGNL